MRFKIKSRYVKLGLTLFVVACASMVFFYSFSEIGNIFKGLNKLIVILKPFIYGFIMAYLMCPIYNGCTRRLYLRLQPKMKADAKALKLSRILSTIISMVILIVILASLIWLVIPDLVVNIIDIVSKLPGQLDNFLNWLNLYITRHPDFINSLEAIVGNIKNDIIPNLEKTVLPNYKDIASSISTSLFAVLIIFKNFIIGLIICVYMLNIKETILAQSKKVILALVSRERADEIFRACVYTNKTFSGFISGKILDSAIIGVICFVVMTILGWPMALLVSAIIGVTNIIPFFGPFIGAIPCVLLLFLEDPHYALYFIILVLLLQTFDGYILGPKILGDSTGLASFWVMFAILVGGGLGGVVGMVVGIPTFAVIYTYIKHKVEKSLREKNVEADTNAYRNVSKYTKKPEDGYFKSKINKMSNIGKVKSKRKK